jgi:hypothetical protein
VSTVPRIPQGNLRLRRNEKRKHKGEPRGAIVQVPVPCFKFAGQEANRNRAVLVLAGSALDLCSKLQALGVGERPIEFSGLGINGAKGKRTVIDPRYWYNFRIVAGGENLISCPEVLVGKSFLDHFHAIFAQ